MPSSPPRTSIWTAIRAGIGRVNAIVRRLDEMSRKGMYETRDYLQRQADG